MKRDLDLHISRYLASARAALQLRDASSCGSASRCKICDHYAGFDEEVIETIKSSGYELERIASKTRSSTPLSNAISGIAIAISSIM